MSIRIKQETCIGCGQCIDVCPGSLIRWDTDGKARMQYPKDCWGCMSCVKECPAEAIDFYLGADMGGRGSTMHTVKDGRFIHWRIQLPTGETKEITVDAQEANAY